MGIWNEINTVLYQVTDSRYRMLIHPMIHTLHLTHHRLFDNQHFNITIISAWSSKIGVSMGWYHMHFAYACICYAFACWFCVLSHKIIRQTIPHNLPSNDVGSADFNWAWNGNGWVPVLISVSPPANGLKLWNTLPLDHKMQQQRLYR